MKNQVIRISRRRSIFPISWLCDCIVQRWVSAKRPTMNLDLGLRAPSREQDIGGTVDSIAILRSAGTPSVAGLSPVTGARPEECLKAWDHLVVDWLYAKKLNQTKPNDDANSTHISAIRPDSYNNHPFRVQRVQISTNPRGRNSENKKDLKQIAPTLGPPTAPGVLAWSDVHTAGDSHYCPIVVWPDVQSNFCIATGELDNR
ncbi:hypothetical protein PoB_007259300 [Plakobranchus ocellatus]|uniref:Uncharacterized protein n=1 Tax=Plakobranchus ocellatus TaxID=259542 RepID=A0AAV4DPV5_9GAST|nr:hypothetical protein PoB_007259300 [Plakobranchus ocellatus]